MLEIGAMLEMHGATGKAMLQEEVIKLLPSGGRHKSLAAACQALEEMQNSSLFRSGVRTTSRSSKPFTSSSRG